MTFNRHNVTPDGRYIPTPSPSLNSALEAFVIATAEDDLSPADFNAVARALVEAYRPITTTGNPISLQTFLAWFEDLDATEYLYLSGERDIIRYYESK
jgi:hypothetical protein